MNLKTLLTKAKSMFGNKEEGNEAAEESQSQESSLEPVQKKKTWHHSEENKLLAIDMVARGLTHAQVSRDMKRIHNISFTAQDIYRLVHAEKWHPELKRLKEKYSLEADLLDPNQKYVRVNRMEAEFDYAVSKGKTREALTAHEKIQKEYIDSKDGDTINLLMQNNSLYQQFNNLSPQELLERQRIATLKLKESQNGPDRTSDQKVS